MMRETDPKPVFSTPYSPDLRAYRDKFFSQVGQDRFVAQILKNKSQGFFVESGAYDGVTYSNSLYFESTLRWNGLLIEANPTLHTKILNSSHRTCSVINSCLSPTSHPTRLQFRLAGPIGGLVGHISSAHSNRISNEIQAGEPWMTDGGGRDTFVNCWPLHSLLRYMGVRHVDYWSLDTEGSEASILNSTNFNEIDVTVITVEVNDVEAENKVKSVMATKPYVLIHKVDFDLVYLKKHL